MTDGLRRQDDAQLANIDKRLSLIELSHDLNNKAAESRSIATDRAIEALGTKVDAAVSMWSTVTAEPSQSPAGRAILAKITELEVAQARDHVKVEAHDDYILRADTAGRIAKAALAVAVSALLTVLGAIGAMFLT